jgi:opacity protein-like surface antigen
MMKKYLAELLFAILLFAGFSAPLQAEGWFLGGGIVSVNFGDDLDYVDRGGGITFSGGYRFDDRLSAEILAGGSYHQGDLFLDDVLQSSIMGGAKFSLRGEKFKPYGVVGISLNRLVFGDLSNVVKAEDLDDYDSISGLGLYWGIGADIFVAKQHAINVGFRSNRWEGKNNSKNYDVRADMFSVTYNFYFSD